MQLAERQHLGQVEEGAGDRGDRDAVLLGAIAWVEGARREWMTMPGTARGRCGAER